MKMLDTMVATTLAEPNNHFKKEVTIGKSGRGQNPGYETCTGTN